MPVLFPDGSFVGWFTGPFCDATLMEKFVDWLLYAFYREISKASHGMKYTAVDNVTMCCFNYIVAT